MKQQQQQQEQEHSTGLHAVALHMHAVTAQLSQHIL
jgi:hypothetical protein